MVKKKQAKKTVNRSKKSDPPENPTVKLIRELVGRTTSGELKWEQFGVSQTYRAPIKNDCHLHLSSGFLRVQSNEGSKRVIASKSYILELQSAVQHQTKLSGQPKWVRLALGLD